MKRNVATAAPALGWSAAWANLSFSPPSCSWAASGWSGASSWTSSRSGASTTSSSSTSAPCSKNGSSRAGLGTAATLYRPEIQIAYRVNGVVYHAIGRTTSVRSTTSESSGVRGGHRAVRRTAGSILAGMIRRIPQRGGAPAGLQSAGIGWSSSCPLSFVAIGGGGLLYRDVALGRNRPSTAPPGHSRTPRELRWATTGAVAPRLPGVPDCSDISSSPGTRLAFRLPMSSSPAWTLFGLLVACAVVERRGVVVCRVGHSRPSGRAARLAADAVHRLPFPRWGRHWRRFFVRQLLVTTGIGPTLVEISGHPLLPGGEYQRLRFTVRPLSRSTPSTCAGLRRGGDLSARGPTPAPKPARSIASQCFRREGPADGTAATFEARASLAACPPGPCTPSGATITQSIGNWWCRGKCAGWPGFQRSFPVVVCPQGERREEQPVMSEPAVIIRLDGNGRVYQPGRNTLRRVPRPKRTPRTRSGSRGIRPAGTPRARETRTWSSMSSGGGRRLRRLVQSPRPQRFSTTLPRSPLSYDGQIVKIRWCVRVRAFLQRGKEVVGQKVFRLGNVSPTPCDAATGRS